MNIKKISNIHAGVKVSDSEGKIERISHVSRVFANQEASEHEFSEQEAS